MAGDGDGDGGRNSGWMVVFELPSRCGGEYTVLALQYLPPYMYNQSPAYACGWYGTSYLHTYGIHFCITVGRVSELQMS